MRVPTDPQARVLREVIEKAEAGHVLMWNEDPHGAHAQFAYEVTDRDANTSRIVEWIDTRIRHASVAAAVKYEWLDGLHEKLWTGKRWGGETYQRRMTELRLTDDGDLALNVWQQRKLNAPPAPLPDLHPGDRAILEVAQRASELGFAIVPVYGTYTRESVARRNENRNAMRRLVRDGWATRTFVSRGQSAVSPTAVGSVEVAADPDTPMQGEGA